jgi:hypothetical protein
MWDLKIDTRRLAEGFSTSVPWDRPNVLWNKADDWWNDNYVTDSNTAAFLSATGIIDPNKQNYINNLVIALKNQGIWNKAKAIYPFVSEQRNLLNNTDTFSGWSLEGGTLTGGFTDPLGGTTAYKYRNSNTTQGLFAGQTFTEASTTYTQSIWVKSVSGANVTFTLGSGSSSLGNASLTATGTWQRVTNTTTFDAGGSIYIRNISDTTNGIYIWHPQVELGNLTDYQTTINAQEQFAAAYKYNLKDPQDTDAAFRLKIFGTWTFTPTGATPNGTNAYMDTGFNPSTNLTIPSSHQSQYQRNNASDSGFRGVWDGGGASLRLEFAVNSGSFSGNCAYWSNGAGGFPSLIANSNGLILARSLSAGISFYRNGTSFASGTSSTANFPNRNYWLGALNNNGSASFYSNMPFSWFSLGDGLTDAEAATLYTIVQQFQVNWNRAV